MVRSPAVLVVIGVLAVGAGCTSPPNRVTFRPPRTPAVAAGSRPRGGGFAPAYRRPALPLRAADWRILPGHAHGIEGFADRTSVLAGQRVRLYVSTSSARFRVRAFRMGWYGGALARLVWTSPSCPGRRQAPPAIVAPRTRTVAARWSPSLAVDTAGWPAGDYLLRLDGSGGQQRYVPLTVRAPSAAGRVVLVNAVTTWQAYNNWGGYDLYGGPDGTRATRSRAVSFDRPYDVGLGTGDFIARELPVVATAERLHLQLDYVTDIDLATIPHLLDGARAIVSMGHDEYWSPAMRTAVTAARDAGANLAFLGANAVFRRMRLAPTPVGANRLEINYKRAIEDPLFRRDNAAVTANWPRPPDANPESSLVGAQYACALKGPNPAGVVVDPGNWLFAGARATAGEQLPGLVGYETDAVQPSFPTPRPLDVLLHSPIRCHGAGRPTYADTTYYVARSGAGVFDAGTVDWACAMDSTCGGVVPRRTSRFVLAVTETLLTAFSHPQAGRLHPAHDDLAALGIVP